MIETVNERVQQGWTITVTGEVTSIHKIDVDKTAGNPKYIVQIHITVDNINNVNPEIELNSTVLFQCRENQVIEYLGRLPTVGEHLVVQSYAMQKSPRLLPINGAEFVTTE